MRAKQFLAALAGAFLLQAAPAAAQERPISVRDSFPVGTGGETVCTAQVIARDPATGELGIAGSSCILAVGRAVPSARSGVGVVAVQARCRRGCAGRRSGRPARRRRGTGSRSRGRTCQTSPGRAR